MNPFTAAKRKPPRTVSTRTTAAHEHAPQREVTELSIHRVRSGDGLFRKARARSHASVKKDAAASEEGHEHPQRIVSFVIEKMVILRSGGLNGDRRLTRNFVYVYLDLTGCQLPSTRIRAGAL
ncbi:hypothetical protein NUW54_g7603 [Trametes sanguinea]|uniref:Uncharacterized protein n=1 Tax=Trametes sanguinea TaxID=158606 RepID=A0ACC1PKN7_9APHY|nr:hypothetical protein NUW54_g7603 [Trametes sanguinea]